MAKRQRDALCTVLRTATTALETYTAKDELSLRQLRKRIDTVNKALTNLAEKQANYIVTLDDEQEVRDDETAMDVLLQTANTAVDTAEERIDVLEAAPTPDQALQLNLRQQEVNNNQNFVLHLLEKLAEIRRGGEGGGLFEAEDIVYVHGELEKIKQFITTSLDPARTTLIESTPPESRIATSETQNQEMISLNTKVGAMDLALARARAAETPLNRSRTSSPLSGRSESSQTFIAKMKPPVFSGDPRDFAAFQRNFEEIVAKHRTDAHAQRYTIVNECLPAEAKLIVQNLLSMEEIWERLKAKYGETKEIISIVLREIAKPVKKGEDQHESLVKLVDTIEKGMSDLKTVGALHQLTNDIVTSKIESKLSYRLKLKWFDTQDEHEGSGSFQKMWTFLKKERKSAQAFIRQRQEEKADTGDAPAGDGGKGGKGHGQGRANPARGGGGGGQNNYDNNKRGGGSINPNSRCFIHPEGNHFTRQCRSFLAMTPDERGRSLQANSACKFCLSAKEHPVNDGTPCPRESQWSWCQEPGCLKNHSRLLHGCTIPGICNIARCSIASNAGPQDALMIMQDVKTTNNKTLNVFWDTGANIALISAAAVKRLSLKGTPISYQLTVVGGKTTTERTFMHQVELIDCRGNSHIVTAFEIHKVTEQIESVNIREVVHLFTSLKANDVERHQGDIDLLVGMQYQSLHPVRVISVLELGLYSSIFGSGKVLGGHHPLLNLKHIGVTNNLAMMVCRAKISNIHPLIDVDPLVLDTSPNFFDSESFGVNIQPKCDQCKGCAECAYRVLEMTRIESKELDLIEKNMSLDEKNGRWSVQYPFLEDPTILQDNRMQAEALLRGLEKQLARDPLSAAAYNQEMNKYIERGVLVKLTKEELSEWKGPVNYVSHHPVFKPDSNSTPLRIVMNSSLQFRGRSLNSILAKGPKIMNNLMGVALRFRFHVYGIVWDLTKAYQQLHTGPVEKHLRRILWRDQGSKQSDVYGVSCVTFGDRCAATQLEVAKIQTAKKFGHINPQAAQAIKRDSYVDDGASGGNTKEEVEALRRDIPAILLKGGFKVKAMVASGDPGSTQRELWGTGEGKVLGLGWDPEKDDFRFAITVNLSKKHKGVRTQQDFSMDSLPSLLRITLSRRLILGVVNSCYDPLGWLSPITVQMKLLLRDLYCKELELDWDTPLSVDIKQQWVTMFQVLKKTEALSFPRAVRPHNAVGLPLLIFYWDASDEAMCTAAYIWWETTDRPVCNLLCARTRVTPLNRISTPRAEIEAATMSVRLRNYVTKQVDQPFQEIIHIGDSECTLAAFKKDSTSFKEFIGNRVAECMEGSNETEWFFTRTKDNVADLGTRRNATVEELGTNSVWQCGPPYLMLPKEQWKITREINVSKVPKDELKTKKAAVSATMGSTAKTPLFDLEKLGKSYNFLVRIVAIVYKWLKLKSFKVKGLELVAEDLRIAEVFLIIQSQEKIRESFQSGNLKSLRPQMNEDGVVRATGRVGKLDALQGRDALPILNKDSKLAVLFTKKIHDESHTGVSTTTALVRSKYWVIGGRRLSQKVRNSCVICRRLDKEMCEQQMAHLPLHRLQVSKPFTTTSLDLAGPFIVKDQVKKRVEMKVWIVIFTCAATRAIDLEVAPAYDEDSFIMALKKFMCRRGASSLLISDQGSQLVAASKDVAANKKTGLSWEKIKSETSLKGISWEFVPKEGQHANGLSESMVKKTKRSLTIIMGNAHLRYAELELACAEAAYAINNRPLGLLPDVTDDMLEPLTPNHLLLGTSGRELPPDEDKGKASLTKRYRYVQEVLQDWWVKWNELVFPTLVPSYKWLQRHRNVKKDDIVLVKYKSLGKGNFRMARVVETLPSEHDGLVRKVSLKYKTKDSKQWKELVRPVQSLVVIVPVEEQTLST